MNRFMLSLRLPEMSPQLMSLIPEHRSYIDMLINKGVVLSYAINGERTRGWVVIEATTEDEALDIFSKSPLFRHLRIDIDDLFIYDSDGLRLPKMHLN